MIAPRPIRSIADFVQAQQVAALLAEIIDDGHKGAAPLLCEAAQWVRRANPAVPGSAESDLVERWCYRLTRAAGCGHG